MTDIKLLRDIDPSPYGTPMWGAKIEAWRERERARIESQDRHSKNITERNKQINDSISYSNDVNRSLVNYLNYLEIQKLTSNLSEFKAGVIEFYGLPTIDKWKRPHQYEQSDKSYIEVVIENDSLIDTHIGGVTGLTLKIVITTPNYFHKYAKTDDRVLVDDIRKLTEEYPLELAFNLNCNHKTQNHEIKNHRPMSDFFRK